MRWERKIKDLVAYPPEVMRKVQTKAGVETDGIFGPRTWEAGRVRTGIPEPGPARHAWRRAPEEGELSEATFWVRCRGCGATLVTREDLFPDRCHEGWKIDEDCNVTVVRDVMEA